MPTVDEIVEVCEREGVCPLALAIYRFPSSAEERHPQSFTATCVLGIPLADASLIINLWDGLFRERSSTAAVERALALGLGPRFEAALARRRRT